MKTPAPYNVVIPVSKMATFHAARKRERTQLLECFDRLARNPALESEWQVNDSAGRKNFQIAAGRFLVTFWPDHAAREVRIVRLERLD